MGYTGTSRGDVHAAIAKAVANAIRLRLNQRIVLGMHRSADPTDEEFRGKSTTEQRAILQATSALGSK